MASYGGEDNRTEPDSYRQHSRLHGWHDLAAFLADRKTCDAVIRNLEVIGEACNNVVKNHPDFAQKHAHVPWGFAYEMRNALAHGYFTVDLGIVWQTVQNDLPALRAQVAALLL